MKEKNWVHANAIVGLKEISLEILRAEMVCLLYVYWLQYNVCLVVCRAVGTWDCLESNNLFSKFMPFYYYYLLLHQYSVAAFRW